MTTLHPTAKRCGAGYVAMIIVRSADGQVHGSRTGKLVGTQEVARLEAYFAAVVACATLENCRVRP